MIFITFEEAQTKAQVEEMMADVVAIEEVTGGLGSIYRCKRLGNMEQPTIRMNYHSKLVK